MTCAHQESQTRGVSNKLHFVCRACSRQASAHANSYVRLQFCYWRSSVCVCPPGLQNLQDSPSSSCLRARCKRCACLQSHLCCKAAVVDYSVGHTAYSGWQQQQTHTNCPHCQASYWRRAPQGYLRAADSDYRIGWPGSQLGGVTWEQSKTHS